MTRVATMTGTVVIALLCAVCLGLAFQGGGYTPSSWLPFLIGTAALAVVAAVSGPTALSGRFQKVLLALFVAQVVWTAASILWAGSAANVWEEANRSLFYAAGAALAFVAVRWAGRAGLTALAALVTGMIGAMALMVAIRLGVSADPLAFLLDGRLNYPVTYFNGLAALLMIGFWLALGMANAAGGASRAPDGPSSSRGPAGGAAGHETRIARLRARTLPFPRWSQPLLLALAVFLLEMALLPQSRGALWTFFLVVPLFVVLSPNRFRALLDLATVSLPVVIFWNKINGVFLAASDKTSVGVAVSGAMRAIGYSVLLVLVAWAISWLVERGVAPLGRRLAFWIGVALVVVAVAGAAAGLLYVISGPGAWTAICTTAGPSSPPTRGPRPQARPGSRHSA